MLVAYLDEFGHVGPYIAADHEKYNDHPVFGYAGFVMPAQNVRLMGGFFEHIKETLLAFEIARAEAHPRRWEKKGASLLTTQNAERYPEMIRAVHRLLQRLEQLGGRVIYYGQVKPLGSERETGESSAERSAHHLRQILIRLSREAKRSETHIFVVLDSTDTKPRKKAVEAMASFIYARSSPEEVKRVVEAPMQVESQLYGSIQFADWICALLSRMSHHEFVEGSEFGWAAEKFGPELLGVIATQNSKIHVAGNTTSDLFARELCDTRSQRERPSKPRPKKRTPPGPMMHRVADSTPGLAALRRHMEEQSG